MNLINIYCDESCHLENDGQSVMALGAVWCPAEKKEEIFERIKEIKIRHNFSKEFEIKWSKVSPGKIQFYLDVVDYFFDDDDLHFRVLIVPDKKILDHESLKQSHDEFYYKMYFNLLKVILKPDSKYHIYLDYKDTRGAEKVEQLHNVLCNNLYDFSRNIIDRIQTVHSKDVQIIQLTDLLTGAISYINRDLNSSSAKVKLVERISQRSRYSLKRTTLLLEQKVNIFRWHPKEQS